MWRRRFDALDGKALILVLLMSALAVAAQARPSGVGGKRTVDVMQVNLYVGGGTQRAVALNPADTNYVSELISAVTGIYYEIVASQPEVRLEGVADQIVARMPDLVSVEEASHAVGHNVDCRCSAQEERKADCLRCESLIVCDVTVQDDFVAGKDEKPRRAAEGDIVEIRVGGKIVRICRAAGAAKKE